MGLKRVLQVAFVSVLVVFGGIARPSTRTVALVLAENRSAMAGAERLGTLRATYVYSGEGLTGWASRTSDLKTGAFIESYSAGPVRGGSGYDGNVPWMRDVSGAYTAEQGGDRIPLAVNAAYRIANLWWQPDFAGATITYAGGDSSGGRLADHIVVIPKDGKRFDAWFDVRTHFLARIGEVQGFLNTRTFFTQYARRDGQVLPLLTTIDRGVGKANYETLALRSVDLSRALPHAAYARPLKPPTGGSIAGGAPSTTLPFRLLNDHIYIEAFVNGKGPFTFIVDTGGHTLLSPHLVAAIGLAAKGKAASSGVGAKTASTAFAKIESLALGGVRMRDQVAFVTNVYDASVEGIPVDGMVGFELFRRFTVQVDYRNRTLTFYDPRRFVRVRNARRIPFTFYDHLPDVAGLLAGKPARFDIDTGSRSELDVTSPFVARARLRAKYPSGVSALTGWGVGGAVRSYVIRLPSLRLGDVIVPDVVAELSDAKGGSFSDGNYDGNIGTALLKRFIVTFDYNHQQMYLAPILPPPADVGTFDRSGLWINAEPAGYRITSVDERSPAMEAGLRVGDTIVALGDESAQMSRLSDARKTLRTSPPGTRIRIRYRRNNVDKAVSIKLRNLIPE